MLIFDRKITGQILSLTCSILRENFMYDDEFLKEFLDDFKDYLGEELDIFEEYAEPRILLSLKYDGKARAYFTCYFVSAHLREMLINRLHFSEQELQAFESILPKYTGEQYHEKYEQPKAKRTHYRKFFK
jgi:hypothetical protein